MPYNKEELFKLPVEEKLELVEALWDNIDNELLREKLSTQQFKDELNRRIEEIEKNPEILIPWEKVLQKLKV